MIVRQRNFVLKPELIYINWNDLFECWTVNEIDRVSILDYKKFKIYLHEFKKLIKNAILKFIELDSIEKNPQCIIIEFNIKIICFSNEIHSRLIQTF